MNIGSTTTWLVTSKTLNPVASFENRDAAHAFIDDKHEKGVTSLRLFKQDVICTEVIA